MQFIFPKNKKTWNLIRLGLIKILANYYTMVNTYPPLYLAFIRWVSLIKSELWNSYQICSLCTFIVHIDLLHHHNKGENKIIKTSKKSYEIFDFERKFSTKLTKITFCVEWGFNATFSFPLHLHNCWFWNKIFTYFYVNFTFSIPKSHVTHMGEIDVKEREIIENYTLTGITQLLTDTCHPR